MEPTNGAMELRNEFARVRLEQNNTANGPRLMIVDVKTGKTKFFDPLELESLAWITQEELAPLLDPSRRLES